jgi:hypothetical protein
VFSCWVFLLAKKAAAMQEQAAVQPADLPDQAAPPACRAADQVVEAELEVQAELALAHQALANSA